MKRTLQSLAIFSSKTKPDQIINQGMCNRHNDLAKLTFADEVRLVLACSMQNLKPAFKT